MFPIFSRLFEINQLYISIITNLKYMFRMINIHETLILIHTHSWKEDKGSGE